MITHKICPRCGEDKALTDFSRNPTANLGLNAWCKQCHREYNQQRRGGLKRLPTDARFMSKVMVDETSGCWVWGATRTPKGYGQFSFQGRMQLAHRWSYERWVGPIPAGLELDHFRCDNKSCVNPEHVRPTTHRENSLRCDSPAAWNLAKEACKRGHEFTRVNTYVDPQGGRQCKVCRRAADLVRPRVLAGV